MCYPCSAQKVRTDRCESPGGGVLLKPVNFMPIYRLVSVDVRLTPVHLGQMLHRRLNSP